MRARVIEIIEVVDGALTRYFHRDGTPLFGGHVFAPSDDTQAICTECGAWDVTTEAVGEGERRCARCRAPAERPLSVADVIAQVPRKRPRIVPPFDPSEMPCAKPGEVPLEVEI